MSNVYLWWILAAMAAVAELMLGTFHLLILAVAAVAGALSAWAGASGVTQVLVVAAVALLGWAGLRRWRPGRRPAVTAQSNPDVLLDIGARVMVEAWEADGRGRALYRGAQWSVELEHTSAGAQPAPGAYQIRRLAGNTLVVAPIA